MEKADIGLVGLAVMGENLILNMESHGYTVAVFNRTIEKVDEFAGTGAPRARRSSARIRCRSSSGSLKSPRKIMLMVKAGKPVDELIDQLTPFLSEGATS